MNKTLVLDHIALAVPNLDELVDRLAADFGMNVEGRSDRFAIVSDSVTGLKLELSASGSTAIRFRHFGFRTEDLDSAHQSLAEAGMQVSEAPHRRDFARMYTSFLKQPDGFEIQLVKYD